jgi:hypothetical protein
VNPYQKEFFANLQNHLRSQGLEHLSTNELAQYCRVKPDTIRRSLCVNGHYLGMVPQKPPNGRLLWRPEANR